jgi:hypothetical protein
MFLFNNVTNELTIDPLVKALLMKGACPRFTKESIKFDINSDILGQSVQFYELEVITPKADGDNPGVKYFFDFEKNWK